MNKEQPESDKRAISIIIPAFNEENGIVVGIRTLRAALEPTATQYEIIVVDDGSQDATAERARQEQITLISLPENQGYGAALKAGIDRSRYDIIVITDADGSYPAEAIPGLVNDLDGYEMVVGARIGKNVAIPTIRQPAKWFLGRLASYLAGRNIPDLNSGLRVMRKPLIMRFKHLLPPGFSFTTTITLAALCSGALVKYTPIDYFARIGKSKIRAHHAVEFLLLIIRTIIYFNPLKIFLPLGGFFFLGGLLKFSYDLSNGNFSETALFGFLGAAILWAVGLLSDQITKIALRP
ncbi:MAG: glycosyltransferase family 2 protein [candidate division Zixibacteria bacterium]|nr:glycosyltransferase family 2 protein [candidate division Zixibacteria bacterium]